MSTKSVTREAIASVSRNECAKVLLPKGFHRASPHFWRETDGIYQVVNFQASAFGSSDEGSFTVNLALSSPFLLKAFTGHEFPRNPGTALWPIYLRIGSLLPSKEDRWWRVDRDTDFAAVGDDLAAVLREYVLPFFDARRTRAQFVACIKGELTLGNTLGIWPAQRPLIMAGLAAQEGKADEAKDLLLAALKEHKGHPFEGAVRRFASAVGLTLESE